MRKKKWPTVILFLAFWFVFGMAEGFCGLINTRVTSRTTILSTGEVRIDYEIGNTGDDTAYHVTVTTFLALEAQKSDDLGSNPPGGSLHYTCTLHPSSMKPGKYTLAARISFAEQNGITHKVYHFSPIPYFIERVKDTPDILNLSLTNPSFSIKGFWQSGGKSKLTLKNTSDHSIQPVVALYLPDGFTTQAPENSYRLSAGEIKEVLIPFTMDPGAVQSSRPFYAVAWYEQNGAHFSQWIEGTIRVDKQPIYFRAFLIIAGIALTIFMAVFFLTSRKRKP